MTVDSESKSADKDPWLWGLAGSDFNMLLLLLFTMKLRSSEHPERRLIGIFRFLILSFLPVGALLYMVGEIYALPILPRLVAISYSFAFVAVMMVAPIDGFLIRQFAGIPGVRGIARPAIGAVLCGVLGVSLFAVVPHGLWDTIALWFAAFFVSGLAAALFRSARHAQQCAPGDAAR